MDEIGHTVIRASMDLDVRKAERDLEKLNKYSMAKFKVQSEIDTINYKLLEAKKNKYFQKYQDTGADEDFLMFEKYKAMMDKIVVSNAEKQDELIKKKLNLEESLIEKEIKMREKQQIKQLKSDIAMMKKKRLLEQKAAEEAATPLQRLFKALNPRLFARYARGHIYTGTGANVSGFIEEALGMFGGKTPAMKGGKSTATATKAAKTSGTETAVATGASTAAPKAASATGGILAGASTVAIVAIASLAAVAVAALLGILWTMKKLYTAWKNSEGYKMISDAFQIYVDTTVSLFVLILLEIQRGKSLIEGIADFFDDLTGKLRNPIELFTPMPDEEFKRAIEESIQAIVDTVTGKFITGTFDIGRAFDSLVSGFGYSASNTLAAIETDWDDFNNSLSQSRSFDDIIEGFGGILDGLSSINTLWTIETEPNILSILDVPLKLYDNFKRFLLDPLTTRFEGFINAIGGGLENVLESLFPNMDVGFDFKKFKIELTDEYGEVAI